MIKTKPLLKAALFVCALFAGVTLFSTGEAFAVTKTWTGGGSDDNWSTSGNWSPSGAPSDGDDIIMNDASTSASINDINGLSVNSITWQTGGTDIDTTAEPLIITGDVTVGGATNAVQIFGDVILGGDITWDGVNLGTSTPTNTYSLDLNNHAVTFDNSGSFIIALTQPIEGTGTVTYATSQGQGIQLYSANTYSGQTVITGNDGIIIVGLTPAEAFGTSDIVVTSGASLSFALPDGASTITNNITLQASTNPSDTTSWSYISFYCASGCTSAQVTAPNITLEGNVRMLASGSVTVDLTGIQSNGHCIEYTTTSGAQFTGGPAACVIGGPGSSVDSVPGVPNTGTTRSLVPLMAVISSGGILGGLAFWKRKQLAALLAR